jgi:DNA-binding transcriptional LysR family regulator
MNNSLTPFSEFSTTDVADISKILLFSSSHPLAGRKNLTLRNFSDDVFIAPWEIVDKMIVDTITSYTRPYGFIPKVRFVKNHESTITCVRNNMGVAILDEWVWAKNADDLRWIPFKAKDSVSIARMSARESGPVLAMENILRDVIEEQEKHRNTKL